MFELKNYSVLIGTNYLIKDLSLVLNKKDKLAIIGEEGNGKSTLLKSILGICSYATTSGTINFYGNKVGYLKQSLDQDELTKKVFDYLFYNMDDYYNKVNILYKILDDINLTDDLFQQSISSLSGGEKVKVSILKLLLEEPDILFLDEPTNDLDINTLNWLEELINSTDKPIIYISHDEVLLANTANMILHIERIKHKTECRHTLLKIGYNDYTNKRSLSLEKQTQIAKKEKREFDKKERKLQQIMSKVEHQQNTISRADPHGAQLLKKKMHSLKSQEKKLENMQLTEIPDIEEEIFFDFEKKSIPKNKIIIDLKIKELKIEEKILSKNINFEVKGNEKVAIVGNNGVGKTTLLKYIYNMLLTRDDITVGYMPQNYDEILNNYHLVLDFLVPSSKKEDITKARLYLGNMNFTKEEMEGKISDLSNGSKAKLFLVSLVLKNPNVLILDEPTRNVSPLSAPVIRNVLKNFNGAIISISHDRKYILEVSDAIYLLTENGINKIEEDYF